MQQENIDFLQTAIGIRGLALSGCRKISKPERCSESRCCCKYIQWNFSWILITSIAVSGAWVNGYWPSLAGFANLTIL